MQGLRLLRALQFPQSKRCELRPTQSSTVANLTQMPEATQILARRADQGLPADIKLRAF